MLYMLASAQHVEHCRRVLGCARLSECHSSYDDDGVSREDKRIWVLLQDIGEFGARHR